MTREVLTTGEALVAYEAQGEKLTVPVGYKVSEEGVIPEDWEVSIIGDAFEIKNNLRLPISRKARESIEGPYPYYGPTNVQGYINEYRVEGEHALIGEDGDHFLKWRHNQMTLLVNGKFNVNNHAHIVKGVKNLTIWFYYFFNHKDITGHLTRQGAGRYKLTKSSLLNILCLIPPLQEQQAIAEALSDVDGLIGGLEKLIAKKRAVKTGAMQELLTGKTRLPGFGEGRGYKQTEVGEIPEDWEVVFLSEVADVRDGTHESPKYINKGVPLVTSKNIINGKIDLTNASFISRNDALQINKRSKVDSGDILMSMIGSIGAIAQVPNVPQFCIKNVALIKPIKINGHYLAKLMESSIYQRYISDNLDGGIQKFISLNTLRGLHVFFPKNTEQQAIAQFLSDMDEEIKGLDTRLAKTKALKQGMMQELLTGKTRLV